MDQIIKSSLAAVLAFTALQFVAQNAYASELTVDGSDALASLALEQAAHVCAPEKLMKIEEAISQAQGFTVTLKTTTFPTGYRLVSFKIRLSNETVVIQRPFKGLEATSDMEPVCATSTDGLSGSQAQ